MFVNLVSWINYFFNVFKLVSEINLLIIKKRKRTIDDECKIKETDAV